MVEASWESASHPGLVEENRDVRPPVTLNVHEASMVSVVSPEGVGARRAGLAPTRARCYPEGQGIDTTTGKIYVRGDSQQIS